MQLWVLLFLVTTVGSLISGLTGMAGGALILGGLMLFFPATESLAMHGVVQSVSNGARALLWWRSIHWAVVARYALLLLPGAWCGGLLIHHFNLHLTEAFLGMIILCLVWVPTPRRITYSFHQNGFIVLGLISGFFSMLAAVVGPLLNPFFDKLQIKREPMVATKSACLLLLHVARIVSYAGATRLDLLAYKTELLVMIPAALVGILLSRPVGRWISDQQLDVVLKVLLTVLGGKNVIVGLWNYSS